MCFPSGFPHCQREASFQHPACLPASTPPKEKSLPQIRTEKLPKCCHYFTRKKSTRKRQPPPSQPLQLQILLGYPGPHAPHTQDCLLSWVGAGPSSCGWSPEERRTGRLWQSPRTDPTFPLCGDTEPGSCWRQRATCGLWCDEKTGLGAPSG